MFFDSHEKGFRAAKAINRKAGRPVVRYSPDYSPGPESGCLVPWWDNEEDMELEEYCESGLLEDDYSEESFP